MSRGSSPHTGRAGEWRGFPGRFGVVRHCGDGVLAKVTTRADERFRAVKGGEVSKIERRVVRLARRRHVAMVCSLTSERSDQVVLR